MRDSSDAPTDPGTRLKGLRVLMLSPSYFPRTGGVEKHVRCVVRELTARGLAVRLATPRCQTDWPEHETIDGIEVTRLPLDTRAGRKALAPLVSWSRIVHTHDAYPFLKYYLPFRLWDSHRPAFVTFHGYERYPIPLEARVLRRVVLWFTRGSICAGAFIPKWYRFRSTHITHGGVDAPPERPSLGEGAVFVGRLEPDTGFLKYLEALRLLQEEHSLTLLLDVCGDGSLRGQGEEFARAHRLAVTFHGRVPDAAPCFARAQVAFVDGLLAMLEAMASGAVVFATYDNPLKEDYLRLFPGARLAVIGESPTALADRLASLVEAPETLDRMAAAAYAFACTQTWARVADLYLDLYRGIRP